MEVFIYLKLLVGFIFLIKGADFLVDGASAIARRMNVSDIAIGLTIVSFGTSAPEFIVNVVASLRGNADLAVGNIVGSNVANILLILGIASIISTLTVRKNTVWKEIPLSFLAAAVLWVLSSDRLLNESGVDLLSRGDGIILILFFIVFLYYTYEIARAGNGLADSGEEEEKSMKLLTALGLTLLGIIGLALGGSWIVDGSVHLALALGISESLVGFTIVAVGTSLPEVAASSVAALKGKSDIAIGNAVGSNIFNIFWVLGLSSIIKPIPFHAQSSEDIMMAAFASLLLFAFLSMRRPHSLKRFEGIVFLILYAGYLSYLVIRG